MQPTFQRKPTDDEMQTSVTRLGRALMTRGMVGCFLSHRSCWKRCASDAAAYVAAGVASLVGVVVVVASPGAFWRSCAGGMVGGLCGVAERDC